MYLAWYGMGLADLVTPITSAYWNDRELGKDDCTTDGCSNFLGAFHSQAQVATVITNGNKGLKPSTLSCPCLFLYRHDLQNFVFQSCTKEEVDDFMLLEKSTNTYYRYQFLT